MVRSLSLKLQAAIVVSLACGVAVHAIAQPATAPTTAPTTGSAVGQVDNPPYVAWSKCKLGTVLEQTMTVTRGGEERVIKTTSKLMAIKPDAATLESKVVISGMGEQTRPMEVHAKVDADKLYNHSGIPGLKIERLGRELVIVDGVTYDCEKVLLTATVNGSPLQITIWECFDLPGSAVRMEMTSPDASIKSETTKVIRPQ